MNFAYCPLCKKNVPLKRKFNLLFVILLVIVSVLFAIFSLFANAFRSTLWTQLAIWMLIIGILYGVYKIAYPIEICSNCGLDASRMLPPYVSGSMSTSPEDYQNVSPDCTIKLRPLDKLGEHKISQFAIGIDSQLYELGKGKDLNVTVGSGTHEMFCRCKYYDGPTRITVLFLGSEPVMMDLKNGDTITGEYDEQTNTLSVVKL